MKIETLDLRGKNGFPTDRRGFVYARDQKVGDKAVGRFYARAETTGSGWLIELRDGLTPASEVSRHTSPSAARKALARL